jgi:hypothetical protein
MSADKGALTDQPFAMVAPDGWYYIGLHKDEAECWMVGLGWPSAEEIADRKKDGWAVYPATLTINQAHQRRGE